MIGRPKLDFDFVTHDNRVGQGPWTVKLRGTLDHPHEEPVISRIRLLSYLFPVVFGYNPEPWSMLITITGLGPQGALPHMSSKDKADSDNSEFLTSLSLINRVRDRADGESWKEFHDFYQPLLQRYMRSLGLDEHAANDVTQEVYMRLLQSLPTFELDGKRGRFRSYLWTLAYSALVDRARRVKSRRRAEEAWIDRFLIADEANSEKVQEELNAINQQEILERAFARVRAETSPRAWSCFEQRLIHDRPGTEIAAELGITDKAVFVYASRVLKAVRAQCTALSEALENDSMNWLSRGK